MRVAAIVIMARRHCSLQADIALRADGLFVRGFIETDRHPDDTTAIQWS
jgi:hypothetical protein